MKKLYLTVLLVLFSVGSISAQKIDVDELPEYVVITSENTKILGGININISHKNSDFQKSLKELEKTLQSASKLGVRTQTDLLNAMSKIGFEYVDAYNANAGGVGVGAGEKAQVSGSQAKFRINMVFRKKERYRN